MTFTIEVLLRESEDVVTETATIGEGQADLWTDEDVRRVLEAMLQTIRRVKDPETARDAAVSLRGLSWIVEDVDNGVVIAIEIPSGAVVAGPLAVAQARLDSMVGRVIAAGGARPPMVH